MSNAAEPITIYYLEMLSPAALSGKPVPDGFTLSRVAPPDPAFNKDFYARVGEPWGWGDRLKWSDEQWSEHVVKDGLATWVAKMQNERVGYCEWESDGEGDIQFRYFGLLLTQIGRGLGGAFLSTILEAAWAEPGTRRVWLHTCTKDHPNALGNYKQRGFEVFKTVER
jgi:GNAT superfamily N-acetyltransferase